VDGPRESTSLPGAPAMTPVRDLDWAVVEREVVELGSALIRIDTTNPGDGSGPGERAAAEQVAEWLGEAGIAAEICEAAPGRANVLARIAGSDPQAPGLALHGHLDVVPARAEQWQVPPFSGEVVDDVLWGRGAIDMKGQDAMILAVLRGWARAGLRPRRDIVLAFFADEEAGMAYGSRWVCQARPEHFHGVTEAVGEVGGFSHTLSEDCRLYPVATAEKGIAWLRLTARGRAGHGSMLNDANAVARLAAALDRLSSTPFPLRLSDTVRTLLEQVAAVTGTEFTPTQPEPTVALLGTLAPMVGATLRSTAQPTGMTAGYKVNVVPEVARAEVDGRFLPGDRDDFLRRVDELLGEWVSREFISDDLAVEAPAGAPIVTGMAEAIRAHDPQGVVVPYMLSGGTDNKALSRLGIHGYGFLPLRLPAEVDFPALFHGVDERVPVSALHFGVRVLDRFLRTA